MGNNIEILAPAGSYDGMRAAMNAGCDAVYIGGSSFGARAYADNLTENMLLSAIDEAHIRGKKLYLTVNTLLKEKELAGKLYSFLEKYYRQGVDAVIAQDVGVLHFIHRNFPDLPIHASTQMSLMAAEGANLLKDQGVTRLVTARELSLGEIRSIRDNTQLEIETFVHGALCYCYSGQCLMSSIIGGRSGNRGRCAQPCRMPYQFYSDSKKLSQGQEKYLLSPKDINTIEFIPELIEAGVDSFKIEGRMKRPEYAAAVGAAYRKYVDLYLELGKEKYRNYLQSKEYEKDMLKLLDVYNRGGFGKGYLNTHNGKHMMSLFRPNHSGVFVGEVKDIMGSQVSIAVSETINAQDILEIRHQEEKGYEFTVKDLHHPGDILRTNVGRRQDYKTSKGKFRDSKADAISETIIRIGDPVYRTKNNKLLEDLQSEYIAKDKKQGIKGCLTARLGEKLSLTVSYGECSVTSYHEEVQLAVKQPVSKEKLKAPVEKLGDTPYYFEELLIEADDNIFVPVAWLNELRRTAVSLLTEAVVKQYRRKVLLEKAVDWLRVQEPAEKTAFVKRMTGLEQFGICVGIQTLEQFEVIMAFPEVTAVYAAYDTFQNKELLRMAETAASAAKAFYLSLPHICRLPVYQRLKKELYEIIEREEITGFLVKNFEEVSLLQSLWKKGKPKKELILNYNMYTLNREAKLFWAEKDITHYTAPVELNFQELKTLGVEDCDMPVYGYLPLMVSAQCPFGSTTGCRQHNRNWDGSNPVSGYSGILTDRLGKKFFTETHCTACYHMIYNGQALALHKQAKEVCSLHPRNIRLDFSIESAEQTKQVLSLFVDRYCDGNDNGIELTDYTTGHFKRGVE